jgi:hypothetical protein
LYSCLERVPDRATSDHRHKEEHCHHGHDVQRHIPEDFAEIVSSKGWPGEHGAFLVFLHKGKSLQEARDKEEGGDGVDTHRDNVKEQGVAHVICFLWVTDNGEPGEVESLTPDYKEHAESFQSIEDSKMLSNSFVGLDGWIVDFSLNGGSLGSWEEAKLDPIANY